MHREISFGERYPCPLCGSSRGLAYFDNSHKDDPVSSYCFSCDRVTHDALGDNSEVTVVPRKQAKHDQVIEMIRTEFPIRAIEDRGISVETAKYFGIRVGLSEVNGEDITHHYYPRELNGQLVGWHVKKTDPKQFYNLLSTLEERDDGFIERNKEGDFYGTKRASHAGGFKLVICEGPTDMATAYQMLMDSRKGRKNEAEPVAVVSTLDGVSSLVSGLVRQRDFVERFKEVVLCMDQDEPGREATAKAAQLMSSWNVDVKVARFSEKDPGEMFAKRKQKEFTDAVFFNASAARPKGVVQSNDLWQMTIERPKMGIELPWPTINNRVFGIQPGKIMSVGAGGGVGKSSWMTELLHKLVEKEVKTGVFYLEEDPGSTMRMIISRFIGKNLLDPHTKWTDEEVRPVFEKVDSCIQVPHVDIRDWSDMKDLIVQWVLADERKLIILDPITKILPAKASDAYELINQIYDDIGEIGMIHGASFLVTSHLNKPDGNIGHENGAEVRENQFTGSRSILRWSHSMIGLMRDKHAEGEARKGIDPMLSNPHIMACRVLKNRSGGWTGKVYLEYDEKNRSLTEL